MARLLRRKLWAGALLVVAPVAATRAANDPWLTYAWSSFDGLPNNTVSGLAQTPDGYLWLGTPSGLARFDGNRFEAFSPTNFAPAPNRGTMAMVGQGDRLWLALDRGAVVCLEGAVSRSYVAGLPESIPGSLALDKEGAAWVAYRGGGVYCIKGDNITLVDTGQGLPPGREICALAADRQGNVWFAKGGQAGLARAESLHTVVRYEGSPARLATGENGRMWLSAAFRLYRIEETGKIEDFGEFRPQRARTVVNAVLEDHEGAVWIGTSFSGLFRHDKSGFQSIQTAHEQILCLAEDREGNIWVGTGGGGLNRLRRRVVALEGNEAGLPFASVQSICQDVEGTIWAVTENGAVAQRVGEQWKTMSPDGRWPADATCVAADGQGRLWIGTGTHGLLCWQAGRFVEWGKPAEIKSRSLHTLLVDRAGDLWIGEESPNAVQRLRRGTLHTFELPHDIRVIRAMAEDSSGNVWAGTSKGLLFRFNGDEWTNATPRPNNALASIRCLYATPDGSLWIGYAGWGIGRLKNRQYAEVRTDQGLLDEFVSHMVADGRGWLWFAADHGLFKVRLEDLDAAVERRLARVRSVQLGKGEGLPALQGSFGAAPDVLRSQDDRLWIPMRTGLVVVDPEALEQSAGPPYALLSRVSVDDQVIASYRGALPAASSGIADLSRAGVVLRLPPSHRRLEFEFSAPSLTEPGNAQFRYRLLNFGEDWVEVGARRTVQYSRLPAGSYEFQVQASSGNGAWSQPPCGVALDVAPFFWQMWAFRIPTTAAFTLAVALVVRAVSLRRLHRRLAHLEEQAALHRERARIAKDIHDDVGADLTQISLLSALAQQDRGVPDKAGEHIAKISTTARQSIKSLEEIVWAVNPRNDTLSHLIDYSGQFALDYMRLAGIRCRLDLPDQAPARELSTDLRHNLFLAVKEALTNIVKHAQASEVWFRAHVSDHALRLSIEDNGRGFIPAPADALADGLRNMTQRLVSIGGLCEVQSQPGAGTRVILRLPLPKN